MRRSLVVGVLLLGIVPLFAQEIQVNRENKTIAVTAEDSATADAEVAVLAIGYHNYGVNKDAAFEENLRSSEQITKSLLSAGIPRKNIETAKLRLERVDPEEKWTPEMKKERQFEAQQSWKITVSATRAQAIVDAAIRSGANEVEDVDWDVADPLALQAQASRSALAKARAIAEQMAAGLGAKLGELVYASNRAPVAKFMGGMALETQVAAMRQKEPQLTLFPEKVKRDATVYAVFAIQ